jgi:beta-glucanase (GH16 family)
LISLVVAVTAVGAGLLATSRNDIAEAAIGPITWQDEFNAAAGAPVDSSKWNFATGGGGFGNAERQYYTNSTNNVAHDGQGNLVITARKENPNNLQCHYGRCEYTSARLLTNGKFSQAYGRFEARMKLPFGQGIWPAFWMLGGGSWPNSGEIDIMEHVGREPNTVYGTVHGPGYSGDGGVSRNRINSAPLRDAFHTYRIDWQPNLIIWYFDDIEYSRVSPADIRGNTWVFDHPFYLLLNLAVGGNWPGFPDATSTYPQTLTVDYIRVSSYVAGPVTVPPTTTRPPTTAPPTTAPPSTVPPTTAPPQSGSWAPFTAYSVGQTVTYNGVSYRVRQSHTSMPGWEPPNVLSLFMPL